MTITVVSTTILQVTTTLLSDGERLYVYRDLSSKINVKSHPIFGLPVEDSSARTMFQSQSQGQSLQEPDSKHPFPTSSTRPRSHQVRQSL